MLDFFKDDKDGNPNKNSSIFLNALLRGFGGLFGNAFADSHNGKPTIFSFIPKFIGTLFQMVKSFTHRIFDHSNKEPVVKEVLNKVDQACDSGTKATQGGLSNFLTNIVQQSPYKKAVNKNDDLLTMFMNSIINNNTTTHNTKNNKSSSTAKSHPSKNKPSKSRPRPTRQQGPRPNRRKTRPTR